MIFKLKFVSLYLNDINYRFKMEDDDVDFDIFMHHINSRIPEGYELDYVYYKGNLKFGSFIITVSFTLYSLF